MNNINRDNYETFFLLYTDNELSVAEKKLVDEFVQVNPDLQEELVMLQQSVLKPDNIVFDDKQGLFKNELIPAHICEKLLLHLDNELSAPETKEMEGLIKADAQISKEWEILQQTKLLPGSSIVFKDKQSLYREDGGRLVAFPWRRVAVAAVFIGFGAWGAFTYFNNNNAKTGANEIADKTKINIKISNDPLKPAIAKTTDPVEKAVIKEKEIAATQAVSKKISTGTTKRSLSKVAPPAITDQDNQTAAIKVKDNNLPKPYFENVNNTGSNKTIASTVTPSKQINNTVNTGNNGIIKNPGNQDSPNTYAAAASFTDNTENNNNRVLFMDEEKIKKTKVGGFFRKVKRVLERSTNIKPGGNNNIKVANLEFAIQ